MKKTSDDFLKSVLMQRIANASTSPKIPTYSFRGSDKRAPSLNSREGDAFKVDAPRYTGTKVLGVATLHKSNAVPVFSTEDAIDISKMRR